MLFRNKKKNKGITSVTLLKIPPRLIFITTNKRIGNNTMTLSINATQIYKNKRNKRFFLLEENQIEIVKHLYTY